MEIGGEDLKSTPGGNERRDRKTAAHLERATGSWGHDFERDRACRWPDRPKIRAETFEQLGLPELFEFFEHEVNRGTEVSKCGELR